MTDEQYIHLLRAIRDHSGMTLNEIAQAGQYGADTGWPGFTSRLMAQVRLRP